MDNILYFRGRTISKNDISSINSIIGQNPNATRKLIATLVCKLWNWKQHNGQLKDIICRSLLIKLHLLGLIHLPEPKSKHINKPNKIFIPESITIDQTPIHKSLQQLLPITIQMVKRTPLEKLANNLVAHFHYLSYKHPVGENIKYIAFANNMRPIAIFFFSSAPWYIKSRDQFIGWTPSIRQKNLHLICNNTRFLILPWIHVPHLASFLLAKIRKIISMDFYKIYHHPIFLIETFVDTLKFKGTCYIADNWIHAGLTTGRGKLSKSSLPMLSQKAVYLYPLLTNFREFLCA
jgi:hypothetical protein